MNIHKNARLTPQGRALLVHRVRSDGWQVGDAAAAGGISLRQAFRWLARHRAGGEPALQDRSSAPARCRRTDADTLAAIERLRRQRRTGPHIARELGLPRSTVGAVLRRVMLVLIELSSMKTSFDGVKLGCCSRHSVRALATSARACSAACGDFF